MSFLSRRPSRPGSRDSDAGRDDEYGDYDYAPDGYGGDQDESWSPGQYFSPEGIKGRWAGGRSGDRTDARGRRGDAGQGDARGNAGQGYEDSPDDGYGPGGDYGYGADEYATGAYDLPEGSDEEPAERTSRWRKDRGERTGVFRLRRDRGEDIWPDDGISDEDYWASVASDRPLTGANSPPEAEPSAADSRPMGRPGGQASSSDGARMPAPGGDDVRAGAGPRLGADARTGGDQRFGDEQRGVTGRLGPPPGLRGDYQPSGTPSSGRTGTGPQAARPGTGPMAARTGTGPQARPGAGSAGAWSSQAGYAQSGTGQAPYRSSGPQASFQPGGLAGRPQDSREPDSRQADRGADWGERTERIERVNASGYPEPRGNSRSQGPGRPGPSRTSGPLGAPVAVGRGSADGARGSAESAQGSAESARGDGGWGTADSADRWAADHRAAGRDGDRDGDRDSVRTSGGWPVSARGGAPGDRAGDDDPLTSRAYSRAAVSDDADGRSYRVAARRSQAQAKLTEQPTATFTAAASYPSEGYRAGQYETGATEAYPAGQYQTGVTGEYPAAQRATGAATGHRAGQYQTGEYGSYPPDPQASAARYRGYGSQPGQSAPSSSPAGLGQSSQSSQPIRRGQSVSAGPSGQASAGGPAGLSRPASPSGSHGAGGFGRPNGSGGPNGAGPSGRPSGPQPVGNSGRVSLPTGSTPHSGPYPAQGASSAQPRQPQQRPQSQSSRHGAASPPPAGGSGSPVGGASPAGSASASARSASAATGQNPYESAVTGAYPYPSQPYPSAAAPSAANARSAAANPGPDARDARDGRDTRDSLHYRSGQPSADGYGPANADYGTPGYGTSRDRRH
jgi:hypothetical protein